METHVLTYALRGLRVAVGENEQINFFRFHGNKMSRILIEMLRRGYLLLPSGRFAQLQYGHAITWHAHNNNS